MQRAAAPAAYVNLESSGRHQPPRERDRSHMLHDNFLDAKRETALAERAAIARLDSRFGACFFTKYPPLALQYAGHIYTLKRS